MHILLVEDNPTDALLVEAALEEMTAIEAQLHHVDLLAEAREKLANQNYDLVFIDLNLPDGQGLTNFEQLQTVAPETPMVVLTGLADEDVAIEAIGRGAADYLIKGEANAPLLERSIRYAIERKRNENNRLELVRAQIARAEAEAANKAKDQFLATISHELRTPLNAVMGWATLLKTGELDEETTTQALDIIERNARMQAQLIEDLLDISRITAGNFRLEMTEIDLNSVVKAAAETVAPQVTAKNIDLRLELALSRPLSGDAMRLQQVAWNLISNAVKFTPDKGWVQVITFCNEETGCACLRVVDSGQGIEAELLPQIFERFRQGDGSTTRRHGGLGLGLAIVQHIIQLHGGSISVHSEGKGKGSTFTVSLPLRTDSANG